MPASPALSQLPASLARQSVSLHSTGPRSALRHRPISSEVAVKELPRVPRASRTRTQRQEPGSEVPGSMLSAAIQPMTKSRSHPRLHQLVLVGIGMIIALIVILAGQLASGWLITTWNDLHYSRPRTFQTDAYVGHESHKTPSHFVALNLQGRIQVIELPGGDAAHARVYRGPQLVGTDADLVPVTIHFLDSRRDHHPDMVVQAGSIQVIFRNVNGTFIPI